MSKSENYKKWKLFKSELRVYYVEVDITKYYSYDTAKIVISIYTEDKTILLTKDEFNVSNNYGSSTLDIYAKRVIEDYEDWKDCN